MWSSGFIGAALGTRFAPADTLLAWRYLAAAAALLIWGRVRRMRRPDRASLLQHGALGILCQGVFLGGVVTGVGLWVPPGAAALIASLQPLVVSALASRALGQPATGRQRLELVMGLVGVTLVVANDMGGDTSPVCYLLPFVGMLGLSAGTVLERRWRPTGSALDSLTVQTLTATVVFVLAAAMTGHLSPPTVPGFWAAVAWVVLLSTFGGYGLYLTVLRHQGATRVSTLLYLTPPSTTVWAFVMFGTAPTALAVVGFAVAGAAVWLVLADPVTVCRASTPADAPAARC
ncbi:MAG: DMT family transporter [Nocardioidaceae bacterium]